jgi:hypothetical protein
VRAIVPLSKGTEILFPYQPSLEDRAERRKSLERYGFVCNCEMCGLPDDLSDALDKKIKLLKDADDYLSRLYLYQQKEHDAIRALQNLEIYMSITIRERLLFSYGPFMRPLHFFFYFGRATLFEEVGKAVHQLYQRHLGKAEVGPLALYLDNALHNIVPNPEIEGHLASLGAGRFDDRLKEMARSIISEIQNIP